MRGGEEVVKGVFKGIEKFRGGAKGVKVDQRGLLAQLVTAEVSSELIEALTIFGGA